MTALETRYHMQAMDRIKAIEKLDLMDSIQYPHITKSKDRSKRHRDIFKRAYPENFKEKVIKTSDLELI